MSYVCNIIATNYLHRSPSSDIYIHKLPVFKSLKIWHLGLWHLVTCLQTGIGQHFNAFSQINKYIKVLLLPKDTILPFPLICFHWHHCITWQNHRKGHTWNWNICVSLSKHLKLYNKLHFFFLWTSVLIDFHRQTATHKLQYVVVVWVTGNRPIMLCMC